MKLECTKCKIHKEVEDFRQSGSGGRKNPEGVSYWCKSCWNAYERERYFLSHPNKRNVGPLPYERKEKEKEGLFWCNACKKWLLRQNFANNKAMKDGRNHYCRECGKFFNYPKNRSIESLYKETQSKVKRRKIEFSLTIEEFEQIKGKPCFYCGYENPKNGIDRFDNSKGYFKGNCVPCCKVCNNKIKTNWNFIDLLQHIKKILDKHRHLIEKSL